LGFGCRSDANQASGSSGVSSGAAAGIGIGCAVGGALLAAAVTFFVMKRKAAYAPHLDEGAEACLTCISMVLGCRLVQSAASGSPPGAFEMFVHKPQKLLSDWLVGTAALVWAWNGPTMHGS
jgi:hypothetical protein